MQLESLQNRTTFFVNMVRQRDALEANLNRGNQAFGPILASLAGPSTLYNFSTLFFGNSGYQ